MGTRALSAWLLISVFAEPLAAQAGVSGRVLPAWQMELVEAPATDDYTVFAKNTSADTLTLTLTPRATRSSSEIRIRLRLRSNAAGFRLYALANQQAAQVSVEKPAPSGNGAQLAVDALESFRGLSAVIPAGVDSVIANGGRISAGGSFRSAENALVVPLVFRADPEGRSQPLRIILRIGP